ncbi:MAG: hypothetical protein QXJ62_05105 [Nitrososphaeria archaeon]
MPKAIELLDLERRLGKPLAEAVHEVEDLGSKLEHLREERSKAEEILSKAREELGQLKDLAEAFRRLGINGKGVEQLIELAEMLRIAGVDTSRVKEDAEELVRLNGRVEALRNEVRSLEGEKNRLSKELEGLKKEALSASHILDILRQGYVYIPCRFCGRQTIRVETKKSFYIDLMNRGLVFNAYCYACGMWNQYMPLELLSQIALMILL